MSKGVCLKPSVVLCLFVLLVRSLHTPLVEQKRAVLHTISLPDPGVPIGCKLQTIFLNLSSAWFLLVNIFLLLLLLLLVLLLLLLLLIINSFSFPLTWQ